MSLVLSHDTAQKHQWIDPFARHRPLQADSVVAGFEPKTSLRRLTQAVMAGRLGHKVS
jgi:hypothetical protein